MDKGWFDINGKLQIIPEPYELRTDNQSDGMPANFAPEDLRIAEEYYHTAPTLSALQELYKTSLVGLAVRKFQDAAQQAKFNRMTKAQIAQELMDLVSIDLK